MLEILIVMVGAGLVGAVFGWWRLHGDLAPKLEVRIAETPGERRQEIGIVIAFAVVFGALLLQLLAPPDCY